MIITITGKAGSGKSTIAKMLCKELNYAHHSMGDLQRELANELGVTIERLGELESEDKKYDLMMDEKQKTLGEKEDDFVIDGRLSAFFIPHAFKIFLDCDINEAVRRRMIQEHRKEEQFKNESQAKISMINRERVNKERFVEFYNYDFLKLDNYDLVIDTTHISPEEIIKLILNKIKKIS